MEYSFATLIRIALQYPVRLDGRNIGRPENTENFPKIDIQIWKAYAKIPSVKMTIGLKLKPTKSQPAASKETLESANEAADECSHPL
jgi:hypothetical protein